MTKYSTHIQYVLIILFILIGWITINKTHSNNEYQSHINTVLNLAGDNRKELEKVLDHYKKSQKDSLKYKAACFLIRNMPYYYSYIPNETIDSLKQLKIRNAHNWISQEMIKEWKWFRYQSLPKIKDINVVNAELLIENIDYAFKAWNKRPWSQHYTFEDFCEYILPYRIADEPLEKWRKIYYERYNSIFDSLYHDGTDVVEAARKIAAYLQSEKFANRIDFALPHMGALFLLKYRVGFCRDGCDIASYVMRSLGIPIAMDQYHISPTHQSQHYWSVIIDTTGLSVPFNYHEYLPNRGVKNDRKRGKVYRQHFSIQKVNKDIINNQDIPLLFRNPFLKDVTDEYYPDNGFDVLIENNSTDKYAYLSVYNYDKFIPIDMALIKGKLAKFKNVENDLIYQPVFYKNGNTSPAGYPFLLKKGSTPSYFIPNTQKVHDAKLTRKYPIRDTHSLIRSAVGTKIEGSQTRDFKYSKILYEVVDTPLINYIKISLPKPYPCRYIRMTQKHERMEIAELEIFTKEKKITVQNWGQDIYKMNNPSYEKAAFDGDWAAYIVTINKPFFMDIGKIENITEIVFIPRNDDNFIHIGDSYELFYQNGVKGWISLGKQVANTTFLHYKNIPENSLLWLHNLTRGKEERPFYMENGRQIFP